MKKKIVVALSGGVDSAVTAYLLKKKGYEVISVFMQNWDDYLNNNKKKVCTQNQDWKDASQIAKQLQIPIFKITFIEEYWEEVFSVFLKDLKKGLTPNPDILCNKIIKFNYFVKYVNSQFNPDLIATGHYAAIVYKNNNYYLGKAKDKKKDQTYFLCQIPQKILSKIIFPLADYTKEEVRRIASELNLSNATKKDSMGLCFVDQQETNFSSFLEKYLPQKKGDIQEFDNKKKIGEHQGIYFFTLGQRRKLPILIHQGPYFVVGKSPKSNTLFVVSGFENDQLYSSWCLVTDFNWLIPLEDLLNSLKIENGQDGLAKFRHQQTEILVKFKILDSSCSKVLINFLEKQRAITPGQSAVLYSENICLGGGTIYETEKNSSFSEPI